MTEQYVSKLNGFWLKDKEARDQIATLKTKLDGYEIASGGIQRIDLYEPFGDLGEELGQVLARPELYSFVIHDENVFYDATDACALHFEADQTDYLRYSNTVIRREVERFYVFMYINKKSGMYYIETRVEDLRRYILLSYDSTYASLERAVDAYAAGKQVVLTDFATQSLAVSADYTNKKLTFHNAKEQLLITFERPDGAADDDVIGYGTRRKLHSDAVKLVSTPEEMEAVLEKENGEGEGSNYMYIGTTTDNFKKGSIYKVTEAIK